jgi:hypothetical protein
LVSLTALENLEIVGGLELGHWYLGGNPLLTVLNGLEKLTTVDGDLIIQSNAGLTSL